MDPLGVFCTINFVVPAEPAKSKLYFFNLHLDILRLFMTAERIVNEGLEPWTFFIDGVGLMSRNFMGDFRWKFQWNFVMKFHKISSESFKLISRHLKFHSKISWFSLKFSPKLCDDKFIEISSESFKWFWSHLKFQF